MELPIEITPNPLVTSTIELRIESSVDVKDLLPKAYKIFSNDLPELEQSNLPPEIKNSNPQLKFLPDFSLNNQLYKVSFSKYSISFEHIGEYQLWNNYFSFVKKCLESYLTSFEITKVERIGIRYGSILDSTNNQNEVLKNAPKFSIDSEEFVLEHYRTNIKKENCNLLLQIFDNAKSIKNEKEISGIFIDIDASVSDIENTPKEIFKHIERLHQEQKELFFSLLKSEYLKTLNPRY
jgi:uncharacterized protein (TIGR04255 family)